MSDAPILPSAETYRLLERLIDLLDHREVEQFAAVFDEAIGRDFEALAELTTASITVATLLAKRAQYGVQFKAKRAIRPLIEHLLKDAATRCDRW